MGRNFFERIADIINGTAKKETSEAVSSENTFPNDNSINKKGKLLTAIIAAFKSNYLGQQVSFNNKSLTIWVQDNLFYNSIIDSNFKSELLTSLNVELGFTFGAVEISFDNIPDGLKLTKVFPNVFLQISDISSVQKVRIAKIYPVEGNGTTLEPVYILDSQEIQKMPNARYNIGIGRHPIMSDSSHRDNHIAIDDNPNSPEFNKNKYVSRAHAYISFSDKYGFLLHVEHGGTRAAQKRTHIHRGDDKIELNNVLVPEPLKSGDYIVLSKYVHLLFQE